MKIAHITIQTKHFDKEISFFETYTCMTVKTDMRPMGRNMVFLAEEKGDTEIEIIEKDEISEELAGAKKYLQKYLDSNDSIFQQMANDELKHAEILIKKAYSKLPNTEEKTKLKYILI